MHSRFPLHALRLNPALSDVCFWKCFMALHSPIKEKISFFLQSLCHDFCLCQCEMAARFFPAPGHACVSQWHGGVMGSSAAWADLAVGSLVSWTFSSSPPRSSGATVLPSCQQGLRHPECQSSYGITEQLLGWGFGMGTETFK